jgi:hypothetical protein
MKMKKLSTIALAAVMAIGTFGFSVPAKAAELPETTDYVLTIPAKLDVASAGWNETDGITAQVKSGDTFDSSKKLTVTAASANEWNLKSGENAIAYKMASATEQEKSYADATATTSLEISAEDLNTGNYEAPFGIVVEDYTDKPAGEYKDTVTFTAKVEDAATVLAPALENDATVVIAYRWNTYNTTTFTFTNNGGTYSCNVGGDEPSDFSGSLTLNGTTLALSITNSFMPNRINLAINFDTTNDTYSFVTKNSWYNSHTVSVNGTDITSKLTEAK